MYSILYLYKSLKHTKENEIRENGKKQMAEVAKEGKELAENNKKKVDHLDERLGHIKEKLNDYARILVDIRDELEIKENKSLRTDYDKLRTEFEAEKDVNNQILHILAERLTQVETRQTQMDLSIENLFNKMNENMTNMENILLSLTLFF